MAATPETERQALRSKLIAARQALPDRLERAVELQNVLRVWLVGRREKSIGAYWPIKGEFDPLPALYRWTEGSGDGDMRRIGLPVADRATGLLRFRVWYPGCEMELDAYDIPKPKDTDEFLPQMLVVPCLGFGPGGVLLGYGGGFFDRTERCSRGRSRSASATPTFPTVPEGDGRRPSLNADRRWCDVQRGRPGFDFRSSFAPAAGIGRPTPLIPPIRGFAADPPPHLSVGHPTPAATCTCLHPNARKASPTVEGSGWWGALRSEVKEEGRGFSLGPGDMSGAARPAAPILPA
jgi:5,10-methenyltetrahydrofolate synthetase